MSNFVPKIRIDLYMQSLKLIFSAFLVLCLAACGSSADKGDKKATKVGPGMPINAESDREGGVRRILSWLRDALEGAKGLETGALDKAAGRTV